MTTKLVHVFTVYRTTCLVNGKIYIGVHKTRDPNDDYLGSGKLIRRAVEKYGRDQFHKEVLFEFDTKEEAYEKERELVHEAFVKRADTYNLMRGGVYTPGSDKACFGEENSQHGTVWVSRGEEVRKALPEELPGLIAEGWVRGRGESFRSQIGAVLCRPTKGRKALHRDGETLYALPEEVEGLLGEGWCRGLPPTMVARRSLSQRGVKKPSLRKITEAQELEIQELYATGNFRQKDLAERFGISQNQVSRITRRGNVNLPEGRARVRPRVQGALGIANPEA